MDRDAAIGILRANESALQRLGVRHAALFGSIARGEGHADSDLDVMIEIDEEAVRDVFAYVGICRAIGEPVSDARGCRQSQNVEAAHPLASRTRCRPCFLAWREACVDILENVRPPASFIDGMAHRNFDHRSADELCSDPLRRDHLRSQSAPRVRRTKTGIRTSPGRTSQIRRQYLPARISTCRAGHRVADRPRAADGDCCGLPWPNFEVRTSGIRRHDPSPSRSARRPARHDRRKPTSLPPSAPAIR